MTLDEIKRGESKNVEFKEELPERSIKYMKSVIAFANTAGGTLLIGVEDKTREIRGVDPNSVFDIMDRIVNAISDMCTPQIVPNVTFHTIEEKCIVEVEIYPGQNKPYYIKSQGKENGTYIRVGGTSRLADESLLKDLELQGARKSFDELVCLDAKYDPEAAKKLCWEIRDHMIKSARTQAEKDQVPEITVTNLENWGILKRVEDVLLPTNAFVLLTNNTFRYAKVQCALFKGNDRAIFIDRRELDGAIYNQIEEAFQFVLKHINLGAEIKGIVRQDVYELPPDSLREAITNAVCHRNYMYNSCVQVAVFDNRVEITSPGMLYDGLTVEKIKEGNSRIRNTGIAEVFSRMRIIENWGTGVQRMIRGCVDYGVAEPEFTEMDDSLRVNFYRPQQLQKGSQKGDQKGSQKGDQKGSQKNTQQAIRIKLNESQWAILHMVQKDGYVTQEEMSVQIGIALSTVKKNIQILKKKGILVREGADRGGRWVVDTYAK